MAEKVIIYLGHESDDVLWTVVKLADKKIVEDGRGTLEQAADVAHGRRVVVLIPSDEVYLNHVTIPTKNLAKVRAAIPNMLEDCLSDDIDDLHFALGQRRNDDSYPVVVIARERIEYYRYLLAEADIKVDKLMPSVLALPYAEGHWSALSEGQEIVVRESEYVGFSCAPDNMALFFRQALQDYEEEEQAVIHVFQDEVDIPESLGLEVERQSTAGLMSVFAQGVAQGLAINLLQGEYKPLRKENPTWKRWRLTTALAATVGVLWLGTTFWDVYQLKQQNQELVEKINQTYLQAFPGSKVVNPRAQMKQKLARLKKGPKEKAGFLNSLSKLTQGVVQANNVSIDEVSYRKQQFDLGVEVPDLKTLEALKQGLVGIGLKAEVMTAKSEEGLVNGRLKVQ